MKYQLLFSSVKRNPIGLGMLDQSAAFEDFLFGYSNRGTAKHYWKNEASFYSDAASRKSIGQGVIHKTEE